MTRNRSFRVVVALVVAALLLVPATTAFAQYAEPGTPPEERQRPPGSETGPVRPGGPPPDGPQRPQRPDDHQGDHQAYVAGTGPATPPPIPIRGPRLSPPPISVTSIIDPYVVYNNLLVPPGLPVQSVEANLADAGRTQEAPGRGVRQTATSLAFGLYLYDTPNVCNDFNVDSNWASMNVPAGQIAQSRTDIWTDWYMGWAPFAINDGYYQAKNVTFSMERSIGPGKTWGPNEQSLKIHADHQPYAAGVGSPLIPIPEGYAHGQAVVTVKYLIWDHDQGGKEGGPDGMDYDWASMGVKPDAYGDTARYVNGYVRGEWAVLENTVDLTKDAQYIMVLLQGQSPGSFNSSVYFDDVTVAFMNKRGDSVYVKDCKLAQ